MKIDNISEGQILKNYIELVQELGLPKKGGKGKFYQMAEIERHMKLKREKYSFTVLEIYKEPLPKIDNRINNGGNNTIYDELMDKIIINLLIKHGGRIEESYKNLMNNYFNFFTVEYSKLYNLGYTKYAKKHLMSKGLVMTYQQKMNNVVEGCFTRTINRLQRNKVIKYKLNTIVLDNSTKSTIAGKKMLEKISATEKNTYQEMNITAWNRSNPTVNAEFKMKVCKELDIYRYWKMYDIKLVDNMEKVEEDPDELIRRFVESTIQNTKNTENVEEYSSNTYKPYSFEKHAYDINKLTRLLWRLPDSYITEYEKLQEQEEVLQELFGSVPF